MTTWMIPFAVSLQGLGLALMVGGMLALGAFTAPVVFGSLSRSDAGSIMTEIFLRYDKVLLVSAVLLFLGELIRWVMAAPQGFITVGGLRSVLVVLVVGITVYTVFQLNPAIHQMIQEPGFPNDSTLMTTFQSTHKLSEQLYKAVLAMGVVIILMLQAGLSPVVPSATSQTVNAPSPEDTP